SIAALTAAFPNLDVDDKPVVVRLRDRETGAVASVVMKPNQPVIPAALKHTHAVQSGRLSYKVPSLEMAVALKFAPMVSLSRAAADHKWAGRGHFLAAAPEAMRRSLVDAARRKQRDKHGGDRDRVDLDAAAPAAPDPRHDLLALDTALTRLAAEDPQAARLV